MHLYVHPHENTHPVCLQSYVGILCVISCERRMITVVVEQENNDSFLNYNSLDLVFF